MAHKRKTIRDRIIVDLTDLTTTGSNVFPSRVYPLKTASLPGLCIHTLEEESEPQAMGGSLSRFLTVAIVAYVQGTDGAIDDDLDGIADEIETVMKGDRKINDIALNSYLEGTEIEFDVEGKKPVGKMTLRYIVQYETAGS